MQQFILRRSRNVDDSNNEEFEMPLGAALSLNVGRDGIIGRRVSMMRGSELLADGIVGFNFIPGAVSGAQ